VISKASRILREDGPLVLQRRVGRYVRRRLSGQTQLDLPVAAADVLAAHSAGEANRGDDGARRSGPLTIDWVIPPIGAGSGGHRTILRFVRMLAARGHRSRIAIYDGRGIQTGAEAAAIIRRNFAPLDAEILDDVAAIGQCDALVATAWQTAYPVLNAETTARKFYFVQDYEPYFYSMGSEAVLAEDTYRFGLYGITAGPWLAEKLAAEFEMRAAHFEFGSDSEHYAYRNSGERDKVVFYARPKTPRRGFELGLLALTSFAQRHPELEIHLVGGDVSAYALPKGFVARGILTPAELNDLYNESVAALVISLTNMSLLPLELLSAGCIPVVNEASSNTSVSDNPFIAYTSPAPAALAAALDEVVSRPDRAEHARVAAASVQKLSWEDAGDKVDAVLLRGLAATGPEPRLQAALS
jgi:O-antigen biosynthesis protein